MFDSSWIASGRPWIRVGSSSSTTSTSVMGSTLSSMTTRASRASCARLSHFVQILADTTEGVCSESSGSDRRLG
jgi:hypothetical protein